MGHQELTEIFSGTRFLSPQFKVSKRTVNRLTPNVGDIEALDHLQLSYGW